MLVNKVVGLYEGRPLRAVIPQLDELLADPTAYLARSEVRVGPEPFSLLWLVFPGFFVGLGVYICFFDSSGWIASAIGVALCALHLYWAWPVHLEIVLRADEVVIHHRSLSIHLPWALFATSGTVLVGRTAGDLASTIVLPIAPTALPRAELRSENTRIARGLEIQTRVFRVRSEGEAELTDWFAPNPAELGALLLRLGNLIARPVRVDELPTETAIQAASTDAIAARLGSAKSDLEGLGPEGERWQAVSIDRDGWLRVPLTRLIFPRLCCDCCKPTIDVRSWPVNPALPWLLGSLVFLYNDRDKLHLEIPWCARCFHQRRKRCWGGAMYGLIGGVAMSGLLAAIWVSTDLFLCCLVPFIPLGTALGFAFGNSAPFQAKHYQGDQAVALRFENPAFAHELMEAVQKRVET